MEKSPSYYDWDQKLRGKAKRTLPPKIQDKEVNSLGMPPDEYNSFMKRWAAKNLS